MRRLVLRDHIVLAIHFFRTLPAQCVHARRFPERQYLSFHKLRFGLPQPYALVLVEVNARYMFDASVITPAAIKIAQIGREKYVPKS